LPHEEHDAKVHWVVTEATVYPYVPDPPPPPILIGVVAAAGAPLALDSVAVTTASLDSATTDATDGSSAD
ncbi:MAG: hypothetical protein EAZ37_15890, partial [Burkholderiales bacterium]